MNQMQLATDFEMPPEDYAGQGNAVIGIRDAGKTYTAMKAAEQLLEAGIPILVYDPVGVWKNLKNGTGKHNGYQVVVAGGAGSDIILTPANAIDIVRAAMKENVSLVIDLYSPELINKSTWIKVVQETVDVLMYENKEYNLRHIFLEEAAEFIPQRLGPQHARVYGSLERLARMGRNARLGMTIINQRAEEVNKAILEICAFSLLHKQVGKNSLGSIQKWLELSQVPNAKEIIKSLPGLQQGECWAIGHGTEPQLIKVAPRNTFHPNPKSKEVYSNVAVANVDEFVTRLKATLTQPELKVPAKTSSGISDSFYSKEVIKLNEALVTVSAERDGYKELYQMTCRALKNISTNLVSEISVIENAAQQSSVSVKRAANTVQQPVENVKKMPVPVKQASGTSTVTGGAMRMLKAAGMFPKGITKTRMAILARMSPTSGSFGTYLATLKREGLITGANEAYWISQTGKEQADKVEPLITDPKALITLWCDVIGANGGASRMLRVLGNTYPNSISKEDLGREVEMSHTSGSFGTYLATLKRNGLITVDKGWVKASKDLFIQ